MSLEIEAYSGIRVYDASQGVAGPHAAMLMALNGADVIKIEPPGGDWGRVLGRQEGKQTVFFYSYNRGKRSIVIDMAKPEGRAVSAKIAADCDVFIESFRPGVAKRLGLGYEELSAANPALVYLSVSGFGQEGPYRDRPGVDGLLQAYSGMMVMSGGSETPFRQNIVLIDIMTGVYGFSATSTALMRRYRTGQGCYLDINLMQTAAAFQSAKIMEYHIEQGAPLPLYTPSGIFAALNGHILVSAMRDGHFKTLCQVVGRPEMAESPLYATIALRNQNAASLVSELRKEFAKKPSLFWTEALLEGGVMAEKVNSYGDWLQDEHAKAVKAYEMVEHKDFGLFPLVNIPGVTQISHALSRVAAPDPGDHSRQILAQFGYNEAEIAALIETGAVTQAE